MLASIRTGIGTTNMAQTATTNAIMVTTTVTIAGVSMTTTTVTDPAALNVDG